MAGGSTSLRDSLLPAIDAIRGVPGILGLRPHVVAVLVRKWTGPHAGLGTFVDSITGIKIDLAIANVKVRNVTQKEVIASGGLYTDQDLVVGPFTPPYTGSSLDSDAISVFDPPTSANPTEVYFRIQGPGYSANGDWFEKIGQRVDQPFRYMVWIRKTGKNPGPLNVSGSGISITGVLGASNSTLGGTMVLG